MVEQIGCSGRGHSWGSSSVYYSVVRHSCSTAIGVDHSNGFPARVFPEHSVGSTVADELIHGDLRNLTSVKHRALRFVTHLFISSSRLFAVALFAVSYKWWVISVLIFHSAVITICDTVWLCRSQRADSNAGRYDSVLFFCFHWLRDDLSLPGDYDEYKPLRMKLISNVLFVIENITLILLFYFSHFPHTWYSLPVTICVCLFAVLGAVSWPYLY